MKKKLTLAALALCAGLTLTACSFIRDLTGIDLFGSQDTSITEASPETTSAADDAETTPDTTSSETTTGSAPTAEGGNPDAAGYIEITVSEEKYFYENHEISFEELTKVLDGLEENTAVRISDENATLKAYENLTDALEERGIPFETAN